MENEKKEVSHTTPANKTSWLMGYLVAGVIWYLAKPFKRSLWGEVISVIVAIGAGFVYYKIKSRLNIKIEAIRIFLTLIAVYCLSLGSLFILYLIPSIIQDLIH